MFLDFCWQTTYHSDVKKKPLQGDMEICGLINIYFVFCSCFIQSQSI
jgi:hypothetical protein